MSKNGKILPTGDECECCKKKSRCVWLSLVLIVAIVVGGMFFYRHLTSRSSVPKLMSEVFSHEHNSVGHIQNLHKEISRLERRMEAFFGSSERLLPCSMDQERHKWKAWMDLLKKLESEEPYNVELERFCKICFCDRELVEIVREFAKKEGGVRIGNEEKKTGEFWKNLVRKIGKKRKIKKRKIIEISGYVLSSCDCDVEE